MPGIAVQSRLTWSISFHAIVVIQSNVEIASPQLDVVQQVAIVELVLAASLPESARGETRHGMSGGFAGT